MNNYSAFIILYKKLKMDNKKQISIMFGTIVFIIVLIGILVYFNRDSTNNTQAGFYEGKMSLEKLSELSLCPLTEDKDIFAKCLTEKGWVLYGAVWCSYCKVQREMFGESFQYINYVECPDNINLCIAEQINGYPTWKVKLID